MKRLSYITLLAFFLISVTGNIQAKQPLKETAGNSRSGPGFLNITELNYGIGLYALDRDYARNVFNVTSILGISLTKNLTAGIGVGVSMYNGGTLAPLFADFRYYFNLKKSRIFVSADGGLLLNSAKTDGGQKILASPGIGYQLPLSDHFLLNMGGALFTQFREDKSHDSFANIKVGMTYIIGRKKE